MSGTTVVGTSVESVALALREAELSKVAVAPIRPQLGVKVPMSISPMPLQEVNTQRALAEGRRLVGRKIGLTSKVVQAQLGVDQPDFRDVICRYGLWRW